MHFIYRLDLAGPHSKQLFLLLGFMQVKFSAVPYPNEHPKSPKDPKGLFILRDVYLFAAEIPSFSWLKATSDHQISAEGRIQQFTMNSKAVILILAELEHWGAPPA